MPLRDLWAAAVVQPVTPSASSLPSSSPFLLDTGPSSASGEWKILTVKPKFLAKILSGCKLWELRKTSCNYRGRIGLVASGTQKIWGAARVVDSQFKTRAELQANTNMTGLTHGELALFCGEFGAHAWVLDEVTAFTKPLDWKPIPGCIVWSPVSPSLQVQMRLSAKRMPPKGDDLLMEMEMARQLLLHQRRIGARPKPNQKVHRKCRWCDIWPFGPFRWTLFCLKKSHWTERFTFLQRCLAMFWESFLKLRYRILVINLSLKLSKGKQKWNRFACPLPSLPSTLGYFCKVRKKRSGQGLGDYCEFWKRNRIRLLYVDIGQSHICNHCWISHHLTYGYHSINT